MARTLTDAEVALVHGWARRTRIWFWVLLPLGLLAVAGGLVMGVSGLRSGDLLIGLLGPAMGLGVGLLFYLWRGSVRTYGRVSTATPLVTKSGVLLLHRIGKSFALRVGDLPVEFVSSDVRRAVKIDEPCVVEVILDAPVLVVTARPAGKPGRRSSRRR